MAKPGEGGNAGGPDHRLEKVGERWMAEHTLAVALMGREANMLFGLQNPARGQDGGCFGDSGGPLFYQDGGIQVQVGVASSGDQVARAAATYARTDAARAIEFQDCVMAPDAELEDILACGCTEVNDKGVCPEE
jgi:hypothetical protein